MADDKGQAPIEESSEISEEDIVVLVDEAGDEFRFVLLARVDVGGQEYAVLAPEEQILSDDEEDVELTFFRVTVEGEMEKFSAIEEEAEFLAVQAVCAEILGVDEPE